VDAALADVMHAVASPWLTRSMWAVTLLGDTSVMVACTVAACVVLWAWGRRRESGVLLALMVAGPALSTALKALVGRPRPPLAQALIALPGNGSMPSGHALAGLLFYGWLALVALRTVPRGEGAGRRVAASPFRLAAAASLLVVGLLIGVSRVYLGVHWASDVLAGWAIAAALLAVGWRVGRTARAVEARDGAAPLAPPDALGLTAFALALVVGAVLAEAPLMALR
jgi:undecaprenyl-diphosphatase